MKKKIVVRAIFVLLPASLAFVLLAFCWRQNLAGEASVVDELTRLRTAELRYQTDHDHYACTLAELNSLPGQIDPEVASGRKQGYNYELRCPVRENQPTFELWATPDDPPPFSKRYCMTAAEQVYSSRHNLDDCTQGRPLH